MVKEHRDRFTIVNTSDRLGENPRHIKDLELVAQNGLVLLLRCRVGGDDFVNGGSIDSLNGVAGKEAVRDDGVNPEGALVLEQLGGSGDGVARVDEIVDQQRDAAGDITNKHRGGNLLATCLRRARSGLLALLVDERKRHAEGIGNGGGALGTTSIGGNDNGLLVIRDGGCNVVLQQRLAVKVVHGDIKEALELGVMQIHGNDIRQRQRR